MKDLSVYIDAAVATLQANLPGLLASYNTANPGLPALPVIDVERVLFGGDESGAITVYPSIEVAAPDRDHHDFSLGQQDWDVNPTIVTRGWITYDQNIASYQALYRAVMRFGHAMIVVLMAPDAFGQGVTVQRLQERYRTADPQTNSREDFTAFALQVWTLDDTDGPLG